MIGILGVLICLIAGVIIGVLGSNIQRVKATGITMYGSRMRKKDIVLAKLGIFICSLLILAGFTMFIYTVGA